ncbi:hypothetical protein ACQP2E_19050 [Actinoplanes sp. CA-015351]|uniref:hypothetical protein n=1 Tax=Actinoplanes sp. CA-015351 TaxID=3239897 RepID=UPI003D957F5D
MSTGPRPNEQVMRSLPDVRGRANRVLVFDSRGRLEPARKRRDRASSSLVADVTDSNALAALLAALRLRPDSDIMDWISRRDLWLEFVDGRGDTLANLGLLRPDWVRWDPHGDLQLAAPDVLNAWLSAWT